MSLAEVQSTDVGIQPDYSTRFQPGKSGNPGGVAKRARTALGNAFITALGKDFDEHGETALAALREDRPDKYCELIASLLPQEANLNVSSTVDAGPGIERLSETLGWLKEHIERVGEDRRTKAPVPDGPLLLDPVRTEQT